MAAQANFSTGSMAVLAPRVRAYFAPVERATGTPAAFNLARDGMFDVNTPPTPWVDVGWIENFTRKAETAVTAVRGGANAGALAQSRSQLEAHVQFEFCQWGKLQMALAGGAQHFNLLAPDLLADPAGGTPLVARPVLSGSSATSLLLSPVDLLAFAAGDMIAVDVDYTGQGGYVGSGISGAYVKAAADVNNDANFIRRVTFNVARVAGTTSNSLELAQPLLGGAPASGAAAQKVMGFSDREGGSFFQEWSALFVVPEDAGGRACFYYPRLQASAPAREGARSLADSWQQRSLTAAFRALPIADPIDHEQVLCYRAYFPAQSAALY